MEWKKMYQDFISQGLWEIAKQLISVLIIPTGVALWALWQNFLWAPTITMTFVSFAAGITVIKQLHIDRGVNRLLSSKNDVIEATIHRWLDRKEFSIQRGDSPDTLFRFTIRNPAGQKPTQVFRAKADPSMVAISVVLDFKGAEKLFEVLNADEKHDLHSTVYIEMLKLGIYYGNLENTFKGERMVIFGALPCDETLTDYALNEKILFVQGAGKILCEILRKHLCTIKTESARGASVYC